MPQKAFSRDSQTTNKMLLPLVLENKMKSILDKTRSHPGVSLTKKMRSK